MQSSFLYCFDFSLVMVGVMRRKVLASLDYGEIVLRKSTKLMTVCEFL